MSTVSNFGEINKEQNRVCYQHEQKVEHELPRPFARADRLSEPLYVVTPIFNAARWRSRWRLYADFKKMVAESGAILLTVEVALGDREFVCTTPDDPFSLQLRTSHEIWYKEQSINLGIQKLCQIAPKWSKVAWVDADCHFARYDWADETKQLLEHYPAIQMWSELHDLNSEHELVGTNRSFAANWIEGGGKPFPLPYKIEYPYGNLKGRRKYPGAPGLAWAWRREACDAVGGLIDYSILGSGDWYMAHALTGQLERIMGPSVVGRFADKMLEWQHRAATTTWKERPIMGNLGCMKGVVFHYWHGPKVNRLYGSREQILVDNKFDPDLDLKRDSQGLYQLTNRNPQLRRDLQWYSNQRNEDALT